MVAFFRLLLIVLTVLAPIGASAQTLVTIDYGGHPRTYVLHTPATYRRGVAMPLMLVEHGAYGDGSQMEATTGFDAIADANGFFVAYPNSTGPFWVLQGHDNDIGFNAAVVASVQAHYTIDAGRIYVSGFSDGGQMATAYACTRTAGQTVAGLAIVANNLTAKIAQQCLTQPVIPYILFHGTADPVSQYGGSRLQASAPQTASLWAMHDQCPSSPRRGQGRDELSNGNATTDVEQLWRGCASGRTVTFYTINGGGHNWPGSVHKIQNPVPATGPVSLDLDASSLIWQALSPFSTSRGN